jgi:glycosyltransferase involved in cell wall biosynthesis
MRSEHYVMQTMETTGPRSLVGGTIPSELSDARAPELSILIPALNERDSLPLLHAELTAILRPLGKTYEIVVVDDGSTDGTTEYCRELVSQDPTVVHIELRRCFGKAMALQAGFRAARGDVIITMDADLQDDPKEIPRFLEMLDQGYDLVSGWKENRKDPIGKTLPSKFFNFVTSRMSGLHLKDFNCGFKAYRRDVIEDLDVYGELYRYIPVVVHAKGFKVGELPVAHRARRYGSSKYGLERFIRGPMDLLTILFLVGFRKRPLHLFGQIGVLIGGLGFVINGYLAVLWFLGYGIGDRPLLMLGTLLIIVGIQMLVFGLLGEMIAASTHNPAEADRLIRRVNRQRAG